MLVIFCVTVIFKKYSLIFVLNDKNQEKEREQGGNGVVWGDPAGILMPFWRCFKVWGRCKLPPSRGLLWFRPYQRSTKLTFQRGQAGLIWAQWAVWAIGSLRADASSMATIQLSSRLWCSCGHVSLELLKIPVFVWGWIFRFLYKIWFKNII